MISASLKPSLGRFARTCLPVAFTLSTVLMTAVIFFLFCSLARPACAAVHEEWNRRWDGPTHYADVATKVAVDHAGNVYVAGYSDSYNSNSDYRLIKYAPNGIELWNRTYAGQHYNSISGPKTYGHNAITGLALDAAGDAYVTGASFHYRTYSDYATLKYDPDGNRLWVRRYDGPGHSDDYAAAIAVDAAGDAYVTGTSDVAEGRSDFVTLKYDAQGHQLWVRGYDRPGSTSHATALAVDAAGDAYVTGKSYRRDVGRYGCATVKYSASGNSLWMSYYDSDADDSPTAIAADAAGNAYVAGSAGPSAGISGSPRYLTLKYDTSGNVSWSRYHQKDQRTTSVAYAVAVDSGGNVLVTGNDGTVKYGLNGDEKWVQNNMDGVSSALMVDAQDSVYVAGNVLLESNKHYNFSVIKYGRNGLFHWGRCFDGPDQGDDSATSLALDDLGNVYVTGSSTEISSFGYGLDMRTVKYSQ